ncbi:ATP-binding cassette subfamily B protein [Catenulispora sp. MAP5-51]|uniref:ABC transporter ATP-binding protein n=1 Tax=Catenulispora sp. MAP5-51 TaxID=3156298 RepID=UPI003514CF02
MTVAEALAPEPESETPQTQTQTQNENQNENQTETQTEPQTQPSRLGRIRALFSADAVPRHEIDDLAADPYVATWTRGYAEVAAASFWSNARRMPDLLRLTLRTAAGQSRWRVVTLLVLQLLSGVFQALGLLATTGVLAALFTGRPTPDRISAALPSLILIAAFTAATTLASSISSLMQSQLSPAMDAAALARIQELCTGVELVAFDQAGWFDTENAAERGAVSPHFMLQATVRILAGLATVGSAILVVGFVNPLLLPLILVTIVPRWWAAVRVARMDYKVFVRQAEGRRRVNQIAYIGQSIQQAAEVRALSMSEYLAGRYRRISRRILAENIALQRAETMSQILGDTIAGIAVAGVYIVLGLLLWKSEIPLAAGGTAVIAIGRAQSSLMQMITSVNSLFAEGLYFDGYLRFCEKAESLVPSPGTVPVPDDFEAITVEDVSFTYEGAERPALRDASLTITRGQVVALVGENGAAKTTLAKLLGRGYLPDTGTIRWDGADTALMEPNELRARIAYIGQDGARFPFTARENIRVGDWTRTDDPAIEGAAAAAGAHEFITGLPNGYATLMDRSLSWGTNVSGGQHQRINLARGFYRQGTLVIADEPTSNLDAAAEIDFYNRLRSYGGTIVMVTHRLNAVQACADHIYVLEHGRISAHGTHEELMADPAGGWYRDSYLLQQNSFTTRADSAAAGGPGRVSAPMGE